MNKRQVWVIERRRVGGRARVWSLDDIVRGKPRNPSFEWTGLDGATYRYAKYVPEKP